MTEYKLITECFDICPRCKIGILHSKEGNHHFICDRCESEFKMIVKEEVLIDTAFAKLNGKKENK